jgi:hypothetical protein
MHQINSLQNLAVLKLKKEEERDSNEMSDY